MHRIDALAHLRDNWEDLRLGIACTTEEDRADAVIVQAADVTAVLPYTVGTWSAHRQDTAKTRSAGSSKRQHTATWSAHRHMVRTPPGHSQENISRTQQTISAWPANGHHWSAHGQHIATWSAFTQGIQLLISDYSPA